MPPRWHDFPRRCKASRWPFLQSTFWHSLLQYTTVLQRPHCLVPGLQHIEHGVVERSMAIVCRQKPLYVKI